jgi:CDP-glucose 4,6-dehydratase
MKMYKTQDLCQAWNFGPPLKSKSISVKQLVNGIVDYWPNSDIEVLIDPDKKPHEESILLLNSSKAEQILGWKSVLSFEDMIKLTVDWYSAFYSNSNTLEILTKNQILFYLKKANFNNVS